MIIEELLSYKLRTAILLLFENTKDSWGIARESIYSLLIYLVNSIFVSVSGKENIFKIM